MYNRLYIFFIISFFCINASDFDCDQNCNACVTCSNCVTSYPQHISNKNSSRGEFLSRSYLKPRGITTNNILQHNLGLYWWYHDILCEQDCLWWMMQVSPFYQQSTNGSTIARYFFPCNQTAISVKEDGMGNVGSPWLNLIAADEAFDSTISLSPQRSVAGIYFDFRFDLSRIFSHSWFDVSFAVLRVKHDLHFCEILSSDPGIACNIETVCQALNQPNWLYGKFAHRSLTRRGVDDIQLKFGYDWFYCDTNHISPYIVGTIATGTSGEPTYIFEPIVNNSHGSIGAGVIGDYKIMDSDQRELTFLTDFKYRYVLRSIDKRLFDLCRNGDWSRYLKVTQKSDPSISFAGINLFTQDVRVTPGSTIDWWLALHYQQSQWDVELGYDFWWRQQELIELSTFPANFGIYDLAGDPLNRISASAAHICQSNIGTNVPTSDSSFVDLTGYDLDLNSGATPRALSNSIYLACAYDGCLADMPAYIGLGGSYEWSVNSLNNWTIWVRCAMAF